MQRIRSPARHSTTRRTPLGRESRLQTSASVSPANSRRTKPLNYPRIHAFLHLFRDDTPKTSAPRSRRGSFEDAKTGLSAVGGRLNIFKYRDTVVVFIIALVALLMRWVVALYGYSGKGIPPMFGDFEAQRHWMELTTGLDISQWYYYDSSYWPLDYPPLTAFHSYICGLFAHVLDSSWVALYTSRGTETPEIKSFMRFTVLASDLLVYFSGCYQFVNTYLPSRGRRKQMSSYSGQTLLIILLGNAPMIIIDHGHFQYNCVMLGLTLWSVTFMLKGNLLVASFLFSLALLFKQMALFYAFPFFFGVLGVAFRRAFGPVSRTSYMKRFQELRAMYAQVLNLGFGQESFTEESDTCSELVQSNRNPAISTENIGLEDDLGIYLQDADYFYQFNDANSIDDSRKSSKGDCISIIQAVLLVLKVGGAVIATFAMLIAPFVIFGENGFKKDTYQMFRRIFPVHRGLFEDKVANFWCAINIFIKIRTLMTLDHLMLLSILCTLASILPSAIHLFIYPTKKNFIYALLNSSLGFYIFSFQVHEKSILLPLLPATMLALDDPHVSTWFSNVSMFSMYPLLKRDELGIPYLLLLLFSNYMVGGGRASFGTPSTFELPVRSRNPSSYSHGVITMFTELVDEVTGSQITKTIQTGRSRLNKSLVQLDRLATWSTLTRAWYVLAIGVSVAELLFKPPARLPDLFVVANLELSFGAFVVIMLYFNMRQLAHW